MKSIFIIGCGQVGSKLAAALATKFDIHCLVRSPQSATQLLDLGFDTLGCDLDYPLSEKLCTAESLVFYLAPPPKTGQVDTRVKHFIQALQHAEQPAKIVYLGTTGVYGDCQGNWIDETQPTAPIADRAKRRLDAEQQFISWQKDTGGALVRLRVAGIYGPDKLPLARIRQQQPMIPAAQAPWTNRIHIDDLVQACIAAMQQGDNGSIYNLSDGQPGKMPDYFQTIAQYAKLPAPPTISLDQAKQQLTSGMQSYLAESRRIDNTKMLNELGINLKYPDLTSGLHSIFRAQNSF